ncbi:P-loop NTPase [Candidatus Proelusimicrobium excrementi]|uniref:P-loop NTPase n=3 Tax=Candidatus Proelusimicrobium excrementi TaxID=3416222 RepID=UPI003C984317|nr:Mrp/NBP35 family ATP-binding protein [Elusimicrobiaceae bacterium]
MSENCSHDCASCSQNCAERTEIQKFKPHAKSRIKHVIGVLSGKGGVGKSLVSGLLASAMAKKGFKCGVLDADITGPSIPKIFGIKEKAEASAEGDGILPAQAKNGVKVMSLNLLLEHENDPVIWRGALITSAVGQFWTDVIWGDLDYLFIDMPPGTGDVTMTVFQSLPIDGVIIVTSPQQLVGMIVDKAVKMAEKMDVKVLGLVENMSYFKCPDCGKETELFGKSRLYETAGEFNISPAVKLPLDPAVAKACDEGRVFDVEEPALEALVNKIASR